MGGGSGQSDPVFFREGYGEAYQLRNALPHCGMAVPTAEHYYPMLYTLGMMSEDDPLVFTHEGIQNASVSMRCFRVG
jgi:4,5-DOPA dioxygenase extradiol